MARNVLGSLAVVLGMVFLFTGCHSCGTECEVTQICCPEVKTEKVEIEGWDIECQQICIPPVHCPFSDPCEPGCAKVIAVKRLKEDKIECGERCILEYKLIDGCPNCQSSEGSEEADEEAQPETPAAPAPEPQEDSEQNGNNSSNSGVAHIGF